MFIQKPCLSDIIKMVPSRKFILVCLLSLLIGAGGFWFFKNKKTEIKPPLQKGESFISGLFQKNQNDSDNDGLQDWKEVLWKTDKNNPDTDGDGTLDGEEIKLNRDPRKPGPDDKLSEIKTMAGLENGNEWTMTDALTRDFFAKFMSLYQSGKLDEQTKEKLAESFLAEVSQEKLSDKYKISDIKITNDNSKEAMKLYGNKLENVFNGHIVPENELIIFERALKNEDEKEMQKLGPIASAYYNASQEILAIEAPSSISELHLGLINNFFNIAKCLEKMETAFQDPINAITGLKLYQKNIQSSYNILKIIYEF
jgi:hypothetical protein